MEVTAEMYVNCIQTAAQIPNAAAPLSSGRESNTRHTCLVKFGNVIVGHTCLTCNISCLLLIQYPPVYWDSGPHLSGV